MKEQFRKLCFSDIIFLQLRSVDLPNAFETAIQETEVKKQDILDIMNVAGRAPSGTNTQPWQVHIVQGAAKQAITDEILSIFNDPETLKEMELEKQI